MINSKKIESEDEDDKFFTHQVLPTDEVSSKKNTNIKSNQTYPNMTPNIQTNSHQNQQQSYHNNINFQKPNFQYNVPNYNPPPYNQFPNFSAPQYHNSQDQPLTPNMYNSYGLTNNNRFSQPQQPQFRADESLHDFNRKQSHPSNFNPQNNNQF